MKFPKFKFIKIKFKNYKNNNKWRIQMIIPKNLFKNTKIKISLKNFNQ